MSFNTWGIGRREELANKFDPGRYPYIEQVRQHLNLALMEIKGNGEPVQIALSEKVVNTRDVEAARNRVTPFFSTLDALDFFCRMNIKLYMAYDPMAKLPRRWFWSQGDIANVRKTPIRGGQRLV